MESTETTKYLSYTDQVDEMWRSICVVMDELLHKGASLRLLAACIGTRNLGMVYDKLIRYSTQLNGQTGGRRGNTRSDKDYLVAIKDTRLMAAMEARGITPRNWCTAYSFLKEICTDGTDDFDGYAGADLEAVANPVVFFDRTGRESLSLLMCDFPEVFEIDYREYTFSFVDPDAYMNKEAFRDKNDALVWRFWCNDPKIEIYGHKTNNGVATAKSMFNFKITHETYYRRLQDLNRFNPVPTEDHNLINDILHWRPAPVSENRKKLEKEIKAESARLMETRVGLEWEENTRKLIEQAFDQRPYNRDTAMAQLRCMNELRVMAGYSCYYPKYMDM